MTSHVVAPAGRQASVPHYRARVVETLAGLVALEPDWRRLDDAAEGWTGFQSHAWSLASARHLEAEGEGGLYVIVVEEVGIFACQPVALLPLRVWRKAGRRVLTGLGEPFQQYTELVLRGDVAPQDVWPTLLAAMRAAPADYVHLGQVREGGPLARAIDGRLGHVGDPVAAPVVTLDRWPDFETYLQTVTPKTRKNLRNARNRLLRKGRLTHAVLPKGPELSAVVARTYEGRTAWLERMGLTSRAFQDAGFAGFLDRLADEDGEGEAGVALVAMSLRLDDAPIAEQWGLVHKGCYYAYVSTWDPAYEESSPGRLHLGEVVAACYGLGLRRVDFIVPDIAYKRTWADSVDQVRDHVLPLSPRGRLYAAGWLGLVRPALKRALHAMPSASRKRLMDLILRRKPGGEPPA